MTTSKDGLTLSAVQLDRVRRLSETTCWSDVEQDVLSVGALLGRAQAATNEEAGYWKDELENMLGGVLDMPPEVVSQMLPERKLVYVAGVVDWAAVSFYGRKEEGVPVAAGQLQHPSRLAARHARHSSTTWQPLLRSMKCRRAARQGIR